ncbi:MAG: ABC transporter permease, partial [Clostridia bacterium]
FFLKVDNIMTIALQTAITAITAYGMTFVIVSGAVDLSIGSTIAFTGVIVALLLQVGVPAWMAIIVTLLAGVLTGCINGFMVAKMKLPPFIATLGSQMALRGLAMIMTDAKPIYIQNVPDFKLLAQYRLFDIVPLPVIYTIVLGFVAAFLLRKTVIGRNVFAVGSNEEAARLSGIDNVKVRMFAYMFSGLMAAVAGIIMCSRVTSGQPSIATGYEANAIAAAVIGGASMRGGHGSIVGSVLGAFILGVLMNGLNLMNVSQNWQTFAIGIVVILAVWMDKLRSANKT